MRQNTQQQLLGNCSRKRSFENRTHGGKFFFFVADSKENLEEYFLTFKSGIFSFPGNGRDLLSAPGWWRRVTERYPEHVFGPENDFDSNFFAFFDI